MKEEKYRKEVKYKKGSGKRNEPYKKDFAKKDAPSPSPSPSPSARDKRAAYKKPERSFAAADNGKDDDIESALRLEGRNAVLEALNHGKTIDKILVKKGEIEGTLKVIVAKAREKAIVVQEVAKSKLDEMSFSGSHQGVIAVCPAHEYAEVADILALAEERKEAPFIIILDSITDTHNLGAIIRTAECCGAHGVIIPKRRAAGLTGIVSKTSAGALNYLPVSRVVNISRTIEDLREAGCWVACADMTGREMYKAEQSLLEGPLVLVIGGEGEGVGRLIKEKCDFAVKVPMYGKIGSLNASVAAGILMYEVVRRRNFK